MWLLLRLGGFKRPKDLQAFWYSSTPFEALAAYRKNWTRAMDRVA
jgi:hypothetical protein